MNSNYDAKILSNEIISNKEDGEFGCNKNQNNSLFIAEY